MELYTFMTSPKVFKTCDFGYIWDPMGMPEPLGMWCKGLGQILTLGDALESQLWLCLCLMLVLIFLILDFLKYLKVYEGIWRLFKVYGGYLRNMKVYEGPPW